MSESNQSSSAENVQQLQREIAELKTELRALTPEQEKITAPLPIRVAAYLLLLGSLSSIVIKIAKNGFAEDFYGIPALLIAIAFAQGLLQLDRRTWKWCIGLNVSGFLICAVLLGIAPQTKSPSIFEYVALFAIFTTQAAALILLLLPSSRAAFKKRNL